MKRSYYSQCLPAVYAATTIFNSRSASDSSSSQELPSFVVPGAMALAVVLFLALVVLAVRSYQRRIVESSREKMSPVDGTVTEREQEHEQDVSDSHITVEPESKEVYSASFDLAAFYKEKKSLACPL